jgi:hypothetical protein
MKTLETIDSQPFSSYFPWKSEEIPLKKFAEQQWRAAVPLQ